MKRSKKMRGFTLVELVLALMVASIGVIAVMALFPVGMAKNKETVSTRSAADAADQFLHTMASDIRADWDVTAAFPNALPVMDEANVTWSDETLLPDSNVIIRFSTDNAGASFDPMVHQDGLFQVTQTTPANIVDFRGVIRAWKELEEIGDPRLNGDVLPWGVVDMSGGADEIGYGFVNGQEYSLKYSSQGQVAPGNFGCLNLSGAQGGGAKAYEGFIINGAPGISVGSQYSPETGNMVGKTVSGVNARIAATPFVRIPVVDGFSNGSSSKVTVIGFLPFRLVACTGQGNSGAEVKAVYVGGDANGAEVSESSYKLILKAEVSWPLELPYPQRQKGIYSLKMFKGGNIVSIPQN